MRSRRTLVAAVVSSVSLTVLAGIASPALAPAAVGAPACQTSQLQVTLTGDGAAAGHVGFAIVFRSQGATCTLRGFPAVVAITASGATVRRAARLRQDYLPGADAVTTVTVSPGHPAAALFDGTDPAFFSHPCQRYRFRPYPYLRVTPPGASSAVRLPVPLSQGKPFDVCDPGIHPVIAGTTGLQPTS